MSGITHTTPAGGVGVKIPKSSYNEVHTIADASIPIAKLSDHTKANLGTAFVTARLEYGRGGWNSGVS